MMVNTLYIVVENSCATNFFSFGAWQGHHADFF